MLTVADMGEGGVKNHQKSADILYGQSLIYMYFAKKMTSNGPERVIFEVYYDFLRNRR